MLAAGLRIVRRRLDRLDPNAARAYPPTAEKEAAAMVGSLGVLKTGGSADPGRRAARERMELRIAPCVARCAGLTRVCGWLGGPTAYAHEGE
jgi:hypothetical protein